LADANKVVELKPDWPKGHTRKAAALHGQGDLGTHSDFVEMLLTAAVAAHDAYEDALKLDPNNVQAKSGLDSLKRAMENEGGGNPMASFAHMFKDPALYAKLARNPRTSALLADAEFMNKLQRFQQDPNSLGASDLQDPRFLQVLGVMMGMDIQMGGPGSEAEERMKSATAAQAEDDEMPDAAPDAKQPEPEPEQEPEDEEAKEKKAAKAKADEEKSLGTASYKKRDFDAAIEHYTKAWEIYKDITYLTNLGAAYFEKGDYEACIETCKKAVAEGREVLADFKLIAK
jgi:stress-induced-phosphoprotein 1